MRNKLIISLTLLLAFLVITPFNTNAKEKIVCEYEFNNTTLKYVINEKEVELPFKDGQKINGSNWYTSTNFVDEFINSANTSTNETVCPILTIEESSLFTTVFLQERGKECNGVCTNVVANSTEGLSIKSTKKANAIGEFNSINYFVPTFRLLSDNSIEWSIDNKNYYDINTSIKYNDDVVKIDENFAKNIFTNEEDTIKIYRSVLKKENNYEYVLSDKSVKNDLSSVDNQGEEAIGENYTKGANCKETLFGDPNSPDSVAWLLQHLLNYLKILGPMIILVVSGVDFIKAMVAGDDEALQKSYKKLLKRLVLAVVLFFVPTLVNVLLNIFGFYTDPTCGIQ